MKAKIALNSAGILHLAPESTIHKSCRLSVVQSQIKFIPVFRLLAFIQSYMNRILVSAGRKVYISFVPFAFIVYDPYNKSFMFNNVCLDLKTIYLDIHEDSLNIEKRNNENNEISLNTKDLSFHSSEQSFNPSDRSFNLSEQSFNSLDLNLNPSEQDLNPSEQSFNSSDQSFNPSEQSFNSPKQSFNLSDQSFNSPKQSFYLSEQSFNPTKQSFILSEQSFNPADLHFRTSNHGYEKQNRNLQNVQAWNLSSPDVLTIYREEEDPEYIRMPTGGQHAGLRESIQHWKH